HLESVAGTDTPFRGVALAASVPQSLRGDGESVPVAIADLETFGLRPDAPALEQTLADLYDGAGPLDRQARQALAAERLLEDEDPADIPPADGAVYPDSDLGRALLQAAQLIKSEALAVEAICIDAGGWDHHSDETTALVPRLTDLGAALAALHTDLGGRMDEVTVLVQSEFGRRVHENASRGTDHGHGNCLLLLGGGVNGGRVYADWPGLAADRLVGNGDLAITTDWRTVLGELVSRRLLNADLATVFPGYPVPPFLDIFRDRI
ncbi:MAG: DUF1501 domain-containing protein, partial [Candidatus Competibacterales bacterium]|nr:DUF1501 domain-containing protein [Candidatus Competibacterales bacterium]